MSLIDQMVELSMATTEHVHEAEVMALSMFTPVDEYLGLAGEMGLDQDAAVATTIKEKAEEVQTSLRSAETLLQEITTLAEGLRN